MSEGKTRSIRDIAHLYISTPRTGGDSLRYLVAGVDRECMPGFHVANLSVALRSDSMMVRVVERSGLVLNVARFLALPARVYAALPGTRTAPSVIALDGIEVWFSEPPAPAGRTVDLIHAPPLSDRAAFEQCADSAGADVSVLIARRPTDVGAGVPPGTPAPTRLLLVEADSNDRALGPDPRVVGTVTRWRRSLADALPAVARDRGSRLSRSYIECKWHLTAGTAPAAGRGYREYGGSKRIRPRAG